MKKTLLSLALLAGTSMTARAQFQVTNNDFEGDSIKCYPWEKGAQVSDDYGYTPTGWCVSNVPNSLMPHVAENKISGYSGNGIKLKNVSVMGQTAPGYITLGTTWATAEVKSLPTSVRNADGGVFGGIPFTKHPDAVEIKYKRDNSNGNERASLIAYLWKGTWEQEEVPSNTAVGFLSYGTATKVTMTNRDRNILDNSSDNTLGGDVSLYDDAELIASAEKYITSASSSWTTLTAELDYKSDADPEMLNIVISATDYFADRSGIVSGNSITIDDVILLYYSQLKSITIDGESVPGFDKDVYNYTLDRYYEEGLTQIELKDNTMAGVAEIQSSYDRENAIYTVTVKGENFSEDPTNHHTYTFQFIKPILLGDVNGDKAITIADVTALVNIILGKDTENQYDHEAADVNSDGSVTIADVTALVNIILGKSN